MAASDARLPALRPLVCCVRPMLESSARRAARWSAVPCAAMDEALVERRIGCVDVLFGARAGKYPHGNSLLVRGSDATAVIDPSLGLVARGSVLPRADLVLNSHCHEDHIAGNHLFLDVPWLLHEADQLGLQSLDGMMTIYGYPEPFDSVFRKVVCDDFHYRARPDTRAFRDGDVFELGGGVSIRVVHAPGHTRGHSFFWIEPDAILYLADVDLSSFGPYYGDAWSCLDDFERTLAELPALEPRHWATFHHIGVLDERAAFDERLARFAGVIADREARLLDYLRRAPRSLAEIARHRFVYRPEDAVSWAEPVERRSMSQHLERLVAGGAVAEVEPGRFLAR
jgi:glyoxylase-like metal-dependent hydrolase (beta-lactamase superfamily II)